jgi:uncharacterized membrane protein HdeD (DUF308 family)
MFIDTGNAIFEMAGAIFTLVNVVKLYKDKQIRGVYWPIWIFYTLWGFWNLYYYPMVDCWWSFVAGIFLVTFNTAWIVLAFKYRKN